MARPPQPVPKAPPTQVIQGHKFPGWGARAPSPAPRAPWPCPGHTGLIIDRVRGSPTYTCTKGTWALPRSYRVNNVHRKHKRKDAQEKCMYFTGRFDFPFQTSNSHEKIHLNQYFLSLSHFCLTQPLLFFFLTLMSKHWHYLNLNLLNCLDICLL